MRELLQGRPVGSRLILQVFIDGGLAELAAVGDLGLIEPIALKAINALPDNLMNFGHDGAIIHVKIPLDKLF